MSMARENYMQFVREGKSPSVVVGLLFAAVLSACGGGSSGSATTTDASATSLSTADDTAAAAPAPAPAPTPAPAPAVPAPSANSALLTWNSPATLADGSVTPNIAGYRIYYGTTPGSYSSSVYVAGAANLSTLITGLQLGATWYFTVAAVDSSGNESSFDYEVSKTL
jgi:hypothetical protein